jgi:hypothetical protein
VSATRAERAGFAALALAAVAGWALVPTYPDYDAYFHLLWGRDVLHGQMPVFETFAAPTEHPLYIALAALLSLAGGAADRLLVLVTMLSLAALTAGSYALGRTLFGRWPGLLGALFVGSSFAFLLYAVRAFVDVPFLALVVWAAALAAARPPVPGEPPAERMRRALAPMALLAIAGLLRPEAWVLAGLYWLWCLPGTKPTIEPTLSTATARRSRSAGGSQGTGALRGRLARRSAGGSQGTGALRGRLVLGALVVLAPLAWALVDLAATGDPLYSLHGTNALADLLGRERGISHVPKAFVTYLSDVARPPVALAGVIGLVLALRRFGAARMAVPLALLGAGALTFVATGLAGLAIIQRYLTVPAVALCVLAGYAVLGYTTLEPGPLRARWRMAAAAALVVGLAFLALKASSFERLRDEVRFIRATHAQLATLLEAEPVRAGLRCGELTFPTYRLVPDARWLLDDVPAGHVRSRAASPGRGAVAVYIVDGAKFARRYGRADGISRRTNEPPRSTPALRSGPFAVYMHERC